ncbi:hypothetical protein Tco_0811471 [Tanacetum coccineum]
MFLDEVAYHTSSPPANTTNYPITHHQQNSLQAKEKKLMQKARKNMRNINFKRTVAENFKEYDQKLEALTTINVFEVIDEVVHANVLTKIKKLIPTHVLKIKRLVLALSDRHPTYHETPSIGYTAQSVRNVDVHDLKSVEIEFPTIIFNDKLTFEVALSCEITVSSLDDNKIDFRISFDESDDEDYTIYVMSIVRCGGLWFGTPVKGRNTMWHDMICPVVIRIGVMSLATSTNCSCLFSSTNPAPVVETTLVASPTELCGLVPYSGSDSDSPDEMSSPEHISPLPAISPLLCTDSSEALDSSDGPPSHALPRSLDHRSSSSSSSLDALPVHSSGLDASDQAYSGSSTRDVPPRLCYPPRRAPRCSEAFRRWCAVPLSTLYLPTTSESSSGDSLERTTLAFITTTILLTISARDVDPRIEEDTRIDPIKTGVDMDIGSIDPIYRIETVQRRLEANQLIARGQRVSMIERIDSLRTMTITRSGMTPEAIEELVNRRVEEALAAHEATRAANALETENQSQNGSDGDNGNGGNGNGRNENPDENGRGDRPVARECTYQDFMKCQPLNFKGTEGVVGLIRWFEKMETVFHISNCPEKSQVKYATCTLLDNALTWWNSHKRTIWTEVAFSMSRRELMKLMTEVYCLRNEI